VIINPRSKRRLGGTADVPTASVAVTLDSRHELSEAMVDGFAKLVAGAVSGLKPHNVYITDTRSGRSHSLPHPEDAASFDILSMEKKREAHLLSKIMSKLADIPGVQVAVSVELETSKRVTQRLKHDPAQPKTETSQSSDQSGGGSAAEPGVQANLGQTVSSSSGETNSTEQTSVENFEPRLSQTETVEQLPFAAKSVTAAVGIPRSFVVGVFKARFPDKGEPKDDDGEFSKVRDEQVARVKTSVQRIVMAKNPSDVEVDVYPDVEWSTADARRGDAPSGVAGPVADGSDPLGLLRTYGPQAGLAFLAVASMGLMLRIVRKAAVVPPKYNVPEAESGEEPVLAGGMGTIGQATASETMLTGREVDDETLRYQELGNEVSKLVEADPEGAAHLIRRWMED
jgi:flagellar biosynthesis/type III secretory pathway M-ring protein FliF/YscJ